MQIRLLHPDETDACLDLWGAAFPHTGRAYFVKYFARDEAWRPEDTVVCVVDGAIVSGATFVRRTVGYGDRKLRFGGVANVGTLPEARGKGYSTAVLRHLIERMDEAEMDFSLLGTGITGFYARLGWDVVPLPYLAGAPTAVVDAHELRPATADDLPTIRAWHAATNAGRPLAVQRSDDYWTRWLGIDAASIPENLFVGEGGYVWIGHHNQRMESHVREVGGESVDAIVALLAATTRLAHTRGAERLVWNVPREPAILAAANRLLTDRSDDAHSGMMWQAHRTPLPDLDHAPRPSVWWGADGF